MLNAKIHNETAARKAVVNKVSEEVDIMFKETSVKFSAHKAMLTNFV